MPTAFRMLTSLACPAQLYVNLFTVEGSLAGSTVTDLQGAYSFENLIPCSYYLAFSNPAGYSFSPQNPAAGADLDSDANPASGKSASFVLVAGQQDITWDAGLVRARTKKLRGIISMAGASD